MTTHESLDRLLETERKAGEMLAEAQARAERTIARAREAAGEARKAALLAQAARDEALAVQAGEEAELAAAEALERWRADLGAVPRDVAAFRGVCSEYLEGTA